MFGAASVFKKLYAVGWRRLAPQQRWPVLLAVINRSRCVGGLEPPPREKDRDSPREGGRRGGGQGWRIRDSRFEIRDPRSRSEQSGGKQHQARPRGGGLVAHREKKQPGLKAGLLGVQSQSSVSSSTPSPDSPGPPACRGSAAGAGPRRWPRRFLRGSWCPGSWPRAGGGSSPWPCSGSGG